MNNETWLPVVGYEGLYEVSNLGRVRSLGRMTKSGRRGGRVLLPEKQRSGYLKVNLSKNGKYKTCTVHRLVATAHVPNPLGLPEVNHKNERKDDNRALNLEWCDRRYNMTYGSLADKVRDVYQYTISGEFVAWYQSINEAARQTGVDNGGIAMCARGESKTFAGFQWRHEPALFLDPTEGRFNNTQSKRVYQYDAQSGRFVKEWVSAAEVQRHTGWRHISECCNGKYNSTHGYRWFYSFQGYKLKEEVV